MKCTMCGKELSQSDRYCPNCGENNEAFVEPRVIREEPPLSNPYHQPTYPAASPYNPTDDKLSVVEGIFSFFIPIVGIIIYFVSRKDKPQAAKKALTISLIAFGLAFISQFFF